MKKSQVAIIIIAVFVVGMFVQVNSKPDEVPPDHSRNMLLDGGRSPALKEAIVNEPSTTVPTSAGTDRLSICKNRIETTGYYNAKACLSIKNSDPRLYDSYQYVIENHYGRFGEANPAG